ncbi:MULTISPECIES: LPS export ABC transporter permease LptG [unclassified Polaromonas]|jgi:lipopolysaccharide export system permease protein|uniref:LPS export ABC transporter permease LptG n=1 Tax=unclassified Polaromonas TaxID=2638319 RepID=UPI000F07CD61|nr:MULTISPECIES: LPS export ABC transporter permease LptG [unclassified Polaromonas]AYQ29439.1 LPS export ABC transporter permease LptG [Polaromonas sp. SP1]QGJ19446.1 LPS export ABC transporter permease LptG [Polaromonas sp. Pch-P]
MKTIRRLIYGEILAAIALVALGFLALFFFFDLVDELQYLGKSTGINAADIYQIRHALLYVGLLIPNHLYELLPISVLIGTIFVMARLAQSSEYTILRTSGLGPWRALKLLLALGALFVVFSFAIGDYVAPASERAAQLLKARYQNKITIGQTGAWLKEKQAYNTYVVNVKTLSPDNEMQGVQVFEFNNKGLVVSTTQAPLATFATGDAWVLHKAVRAEFEVSAGITGTGKPQDAARVNRATLETFRWPTEISAEMVSVALLKPERMGTIDLFNYVRHLDANGQTAQRYEIEFWKKVFYPLSCLVMVILALPFAYLHFRSGGIAGYVFAGVMIGISFFLLNNVFGYIGNLRNWQPWLAAATPGLLYMAVSLGAFGWLVLRR